MNAHDTLPPDRLARGYTVYSSGQYLQSTILLLFRLSYGWEMYLSGFRHLHDVDTMVGRFQDWGVPFPRFNVYVSGITELTGGTLLMLGLATRLVSIPLVFNFLVAIATAGKMKVQQALFGGDHLRDYNAGHLGGLEGIVDDTAFPFLLTSLLTLTLGAGKVSLDYLIHRLWYLPRTRAPKLAPTS
jgi:putative oxidoreductase